MNSESKSQMLDKFVPYYPTKDTRNFPIFPILSIILIFGG